MYARRQTRPKPLKSTPKKWAAPTAGWIANRNLSDPQEIGGQGAAILDNFFPKSSSVKLRRGKQRYVQVAAGLPVGAMFSYVNGDNQRLFAANAQTIYDIGSLPQSVAATGYTSDDWEVVQFATTGGVFLVGVNGANPGFLYNGSGAFAALNVTFATGITTADMAYVWVYKNRLWFAQENSMDAWYLAVDSIAGQATKFPLGRVFPRGGSLLFGQAWSTDAGAQGGLSEQCVFVSDRGEVAVYQGDDPATAGAFTKVGTYRIGTPLGRRAFLRGGGDLAIATSVGLVPLSKAISLDVTSLNVATVSYRIADAWTEAIEQRGNDGWQCEIWAEQKMAVISPPNLPAADMPVLFVSNTETGAWTRYTNWYAMSMEVFRGRLYFGSEDGQVFLANTSGLDDDQAYTGTVLPLFEDLGSSMSTKIGQVGRGVARANTLVAESVTLKVDFDLDLGAAPDASSIVSDNLWGTGVWGQSVWGSTTPETINQQWRSVSGIGYAMSLGYRVTSGQISPLDVELIRLEMTYTEAAVIT